MTPSEPNGKRGVSWESGTLSTFELEQVLMDVCADLWADSYRRDDPDETRRYRIFRRKVETAIYCATGKELWLSRNPTTEGR